MGEERQFRFTITLLMVEIMHFITLRRRSHCGRAHTGWSCRQTYNQESAKAFFSLLPQIITQTLNCDVTMGEIRQPTRNTQTTSDGDYHRAAVSSQAPPNPNNSACAEDSPLRSSAYRCIQRGAEVPSARTAPQADAATDRGASIGADRHPLHAVGDR